MGAPNTSSPTVVAPGQRLADDDTLNATFGNPPQSTMANQVATGATQATALPISGAVNQIATVAANTGVALGGVNGLCVPVGGSQIVFNDGANPLKVYPPYNFNTGIASGATIDGGAANASVTLTNGSRCEYWNMGGGVWKSSLLGATSS